MIKIDKNKIEQVVLNEMADMEINNFCSLTVCIGDVDGMQVHLVVTKEEDDYIDAHDQFICVTESN